MTKTQTTISKPDAIAARLERIRNKPAIQLTAGEIAMLSTAEQRWVLSYRSEVRARERGRAEKERV